MVLGDEAPGRVCPCCVNALWIASLFLACMHRGCEGFLNDRLTIHVCTPQVSMGY